MATYKLQNFKRDYECTNIVAVVTEGDEPLPARFSADFKRNDAADLSNLTQLYRETQNGQSVRVFGYL